jgi:hypothetical protein
MADPDEPADDDRRPASTPFYSSPDGPAANESPGAPPAAGPSWLRTRWNDLREGLGFLGGVLFVLLWLTLIAGAFGLACAACVYPIAQVVK